MVSGQMGLFQEIVARVLLLAAVAVAAVRCTVQASRPAASPSASTSAVASPGLHVVARIRLPGGNSRFDYASLDPGRSLLLMALWAPARWPRSTSAPAGWRGQFPAWQVHGCW